MATKPKQPTGTFDNQRTQHREVWYDGKLEVRRSKTFIDSESQRDYTHGANVHPWGHYKDLP